MAEKRTEVVQPEGNYYDKYHSVNPIVKWMMKGFKDAIRELLDLVEKEFYQVCETGCGEGEITSFIKELYPEAEIDAFDISEKVIERQVRGLRILISTLEIFIQWRLTKREKTKSIF